MTGIELLRKYAETRQAAATCRQLPDALGKECDDFGSCSDCHRFVCKAIADQIEREIDEAVADEVADTLSAYEMNTNARWYSAVEDGPGNDCRDEYELISRYWLPRPRFEDGEVVQMGDEYVSEGGNVYKCDGYRVYQDGEFELLTETSQHCWYTPRFELGGKVKRPEPPDTWERIEADVAKGYACHYFGNSDGESCKGCRVREECVKSPLSRGELMALDVMRRCKKLAGVE